MKHLRLVRRQIEEKDKTLIRYQKRLNEIYKLQRAIAPVPLEKPIQRGYQQTFKVRDDVARRGEARDFEQILKVINNTVYCKNQDFKVKKHHSKQLEAIPHHLRHISTHKWAKLNWPSKLTKWFDFKTKHITTKSGRLRLVKGYFFKYPYYFDTKVDPYFLTHSQPIDPLLEREEAEIKAYMKHHCGWERLSHLKGHNYSKWDNIDDEKAERKEYREMLRLEMEEFEDNYLDAPVL